MSSHNPLGSMVSDKQSDVNVFEDPLYVTSQFFIADFTIPCLSTVWLCVSKQIFIKIPLMIWVPGMCGLISFTKFARVQPLFLQIFLLSLSYDSHYVYVGIPDDVPTGLRLPFSSLLRLGDLNWPILKFANSFFCSLKYLLEPKWSCFSVYRSYFVSLHAL